MPVFTVSKSSAGLCNMATGSLVGDVCFETVILATDTYFSGLPVQSTLSVSGVLLTTEHVKDVAGNWNLKQVSTDVVGVQSVVYEVVVFPPPFPACYSASESFTDGMLIGWAIVAVMVLVLFVSAAKKLLDAYV